MHELKSFVCVCVYLREYIFKFQQKCFAFKKYLREKNPISMTEFANDKKLNKEDISDINDHVTQAAKYIIEKKGYTSWAIGLVINQIVKIIVKDEKTIVPLSTNIQVSHNKSVCIGLPVILGREGIIQNLDFAMNEEETKRFNQSVTKILGIIESL